MSDRDTPSNVFTHGSLPKADPVDALPDDLAVLISDWIALSRKIALSGPLKGKKLWRFYSVIGQLIPLVNARFRVGSGFLTMAATDPATTPGSDALWALHTKGRIILEALARREAMARRTVTKSRPPDINGGGPAPLADHSELVSAPSEDGTDATEAPATPEMSAGLNDLQQAAFTSLLFVRAAERLKRSLEGSDEDAIFVECGSYCRYASELEALFARKDWERHRDLTVPALRLGHTLDARWLILKRRSGLAEFDMMSLIDVSTTEYNPDDPFPFWVGHELTYRRFYENAVELLEALGQPVKDPGPIPFLDTLDPSDNDPAATGLQTSGQAAPPLATAPSKEKLPGTAQIDYQALADKLRKKKQPLRAELVEFMADKESADVDDIAENVHKDPDTSEDAIRHNANRTSESLRELGSLLFFRLSGGKIHREIRPE
jgi:hypothetical protein